MNSLFKKDLESLFFSDGGYPGHSLLFKLLNDNKLTEWRKGGFPKRKVKLLALLDLNQYDQ